MDERYHKPCFQQCGKPLLSTMGGQLVAEPRGAHITVHNRRSSFDGRVNGVILVLKDFVSRGSSRSDVRALCSKAGNSRPSPINF